MLMSVLHGSKTVATDILVRLASIAMVLSFTSA
jgi:hypothetical protein